MSPPPRVRGALCVQLLLAAAVELSEERSTVVCSSLEDSGANRPPSPLRKKKKKNNRSRNRPSRPPTITAAMPVCEEWSALSRILMSEWEVNMNMVRSRGFVDRRGNNLFPE